MGQLKSYRVRTSDGAVAEITAANLDAAISLARLKFGQLPNEVNTKIVRSVSKSLDGLSIRDSVEKLNRYRSQLDWEKAHKEVLDIADTLSSVADSIRETANSMVRSVR